MTSNIVLDITSKTHAHHAVRIVSPYHDHFEMKITFDSESHVFSFFANIHFINFLFITPTINA